MVKVDNSLHSPCRKCAYHQMLTSNTVCCMFCVATGEARGEEFGQAEHGKCDKFTPCTQKEHDKYWRMINNMDNNPNRPNAFTINSYRYSRQAIDEYEKKRREKANERKRFMRKQAEEQSEMVE